MKIHLITSKYLLVLFFFNVLNTLDSVSVNASVTYNEIRGKILDKETLEAIPFSNILVKNTYIGTCSNNRGEFIFYYPDSLANRDLTISCIGYKTITLKLDSLSKTNIALIYLKPEAYKISEITVNQNQLTATDIIKLVIRNMHNNYPRHQYYMEGFLRDKTFNLFDKKNVRLTETAVEIVKKEFGGENTADRVKIFEIRNSYNYSNLGSTWKEKLNQMLYGYSKVSPAYVVLQNHDFIDPSALRKLLKNDLYSIKFSGMTIYDDKPVQIIDIKEEYIEFMFQRTKTNIFYSLIRLYIDTETYAILKSEYFTVTKFSPEKLEGIKFHFKQDTISNYSVKMYENLQDKYYLKYAGYFGRMHDQPDMGDEKTLYFNETELLITKVITNRREFDRIKHRDLLEKDTPLWNMKYVYDPSFWKNYNILIDKPLDSSIVKDMERDTRLDEQFNDGGSKNSKLSK